VPEDPADDPGPEGVDDGDADHEQRDKPELRGRSGESEEEQQEEHDGHEW